MRDGRDIDVDEDPSRLVEGAAARRRRAARADRAAVALSGADRAVRPARSVVRGRRRGREAPRCRRCDRGCTKAGSCCGCGWRGCARRTRCPASSGRFDARHDTASPRRRAQRAGLGRLRRRRRRGRRAAVARGAGDARGAGGDGAEAAGAPRPSGAAVSWFAGITRHRGQPPRGRGVVARARRAGPVARRRAAGRAPRRRDSPAHDSGVGRIRVERADGRRACGASRADDQHRSRPRAGDAARARLASRPLFDPADGVGPVRAPGAVRAKSFGAPTVEPAFTNGRPTHAIAEPRRRRRARGRRRRPARSAALAGTAPEAWSSRSFKAVFDPEAGESAPALAPIRLDQATPTRRRRPRADPPAPPTSSERGDRSIVRAASRPDRCAGPATRSARSPAPTIDSSRATDGSSDVAASGDTP